MKYSTHFNKSTSMEACEYTLCLLLREWEFFLFQKQLKIKKRTHNQGLKTLHWTEISLIGLYFHGYQISTQTS